MLRLYQERNEQNKSQSFHVVSCYYLQCEPDSLTSNELSIIEWILQARPSGVVSTYKHFPSSLWEFEIGLRLNFCSPFSTNVVSILRSVNIWNIHRVEQTLVYFSSEEAQKPENLQDGELFDPITHCIYDQPLSSFCNAELSVPDTYDVDVLGLGRAGLVEENLRVGLGFDDWDVDYYANLFMKILRRNPTNVECFDLAQSNSEHSRHWFFKGTLLLDGRRRLPGSLFDLVVDTQSSSNQNNVLRFQDNSSGIEGFSVKVLRPEDSAKCCKFEVLPLLRHIIFTAETHNFPTGVAPMPGAATGSGGRIRDVQAAGRGGHVIAGTAGYCVGNLLLKDFVISGEDPSPEKPDHFASPLKILIEASNGASDYGNKFGEPLVCGFVRSFGQKVDGEHYEWMKPIMFSGGLGSLDDHHVWKVAPELDMLIAKIGGPAYRIGLGGGSTSSIQIQGGSKSEMNAIQRGDPEMEQKMNRVVRACIEQNSNPIMSIHDQGAGGNCNVLKEICEPAGATIYRSRFQPGDDSLSALELWAAEYQESNAILLRKSALCKVQAIAKRERCHLEVVGKVEQHGKIKFLESETNSKCHVDLDLKQVLGEMPRKTFHLKEIPREHTDRLSLPNNFSVHQLLCEVFRLPSVGSKEFLTSKVDRSVSGLVAQQQCVGPLHLPVADFAVIALSHFEKVGSVTSIGEQPIKCLANASNGARLSLGEALTNIIFAPISGLRDIKCSVNWMWPAKLDGEGVRMVQACESLCAAMQEIGVAADGGKDSLSMATQTSGSVIKSPGSVVVSAYVQCTDITSIITPDMKAPNGKGVLIHVKLSGGEGRLGGSALSQIMNQTYLQPPNLDSPSKFAQDFLAIHSAVKAGLICAGHDVSDGGVVACLVEMAIAGNVGLAVDFRTHKCSDVEFLFAEELAVLMEVAEDGLSEVLKLLSECDLQVIGFSKQSSCQVLVECHGKEVLSESLAELRSKWQEVSFELEKYQTDHLCIEMLRQVGKASSQPSYHLTFNPDENCAKKLNGNPRVPSVAIIREEGTNGDREMAAAFWAAGFEVWDVHMSDWIEGTVSIMSFDGIVFAGGFSYADACGAARGWAASLKFNQSLRDDLKSFLARENSFSLGICNGCQLMMLLGLFSNLPFQDVALLGKNDSGRFESRFASVKILATNSVFLQGMEGSVLGIWIAHAEGKLSNTLPSARACLQYVDSAGQPTQMYPLNPNGSVDAAAGWVSPNGHHMALMPHPERLAFKWQWPWLPQNLRHVSASPWARMFGNIYQFASGGTD